MTSTMPAQDWSSLESGCSDIFITSIGAIIADGCMAPMKMRCWGEMGNRVGVHAFGRGSYRASNSSPRKVLPR